MTSALHTLLAQSHSVPMQSSVTQQQVVSLEFLDLNGSAVFMGLGEEIHSLTLSMSTLN